MATSEKKTKKSKLPFWAKFGLIVIAIVAVALQYKFLPKGAGWISLEAMTLVLTWIGIDLRKWIHYAEKASPQYFLMKETFPKIRFIAVVVFGTLAAFVFWGWFAAVIAALILGWGVIYIYPSKTDRQELAIWITLISLVLAYGAMKFFHLTWWYFTAIFVSIAVSLIAWANRKKLPWKAIVAIVIGLWLLFLVGAGINAIVHTWWVSGLIEFAILIIFGVLGLLSYHSYLSFADKVDNFADWLMYVPDETPTAEERLTAAVETIRQEDTPENEQTFLELCSELGINFGETDVWTMVRGSDEVEDVVGALMSMIPVEEPSPAEETASKGPSRWIKVVDGLRKQVYNNIKVWHVAIVVTFVAIIGLVINGFKGFLTSMAILVLVTLIAVGITALIRRYRTAKTEKAIAPKPAAESAGTDDDEETMTILEFLQTLGKGLRPTQREKIGVSAILIGTCFLAVMILALIFGWIASIDRYVQQNVGHETTQVVAPTRWPTPAFTATPAPIQDIAGPLATQKAEFGQALQGFGLAMQTPQAENDAENLNQWSEINALNAQMNNMYDAVSTLESNNANLQTTVNTQATTIATLQTPAPTNTPTPTATPTPTVNPSSTANPTATATPGVLPTIGPKP